jgi:hypothetical protein
MVNKTAKTSRSKNDSNTFYRLKIKRQWNNTMTETDYFFSKIDLC